MVEVTFEYADAMSNWEWRKQHCIMSSLEKVIEWYGLGKDCEYRILDVKEINNDRN